MFDGCISLPLLVPYNLLDLLYELFELLFIHGTANGITILSWRKPKLSLDFKLELFLVYFIADAV